MTEPIHRKLIEVALPLEAINRESQRDNSTLSGHPWNLHYWFARRKLPACRAMLFAQLVDDPSSRPEDFPTEKDQETERKRLFAMIERLVVWDNAGDESLLKQAHDEILKSSHGNPPPILDPFAGGGSIPLEAQRLGLDAHASDLNPVAVLINKGLIELPAKFAGSQPVHPDVGRTIRHWPRATGLAEDVLHYGMWMRAQAEQRIGNLYPKAQLENGTTADVIAWIWARTVKCPNPACRSEIPLASTWWLSKKKERPTWIHPVVKGKQVEFEIRVDKSGPSDPPKKGRGAKFTCLICSDTTSDAYIKSEAVAGRMGARLLSVVAEGKRQRVYLPASALHVEAADIARPEDVPEEKLAIDPRNIWCVSYGLTKFSDLFTNRQLVALTTFSDLVSEARDRVAADAKVAGRTVEEAEKYADAVALYLAFVVDRASDNWSSIASWHSGNGQLRNVFARQAIPMVWDYAEANPFSSQSVGWENLLARYPESIRRLGFGTPGTVAQRSATTTPDHTFVLATDPPYYDNVGYADLADYFYVWLRRSIGSRYPSVAGTLLTPKTEELIASPYRFDGSKQRAAKHFEDGFVEVFRGAREKLVPGYPITVVYAFKQSETDQSGVVSTGWETMLSGLISAGFMITATWPVHTERPTRTLAMLTNALASSIFLAGRPRPDSAEATSRRGFISSLKSELPDALRHLQQGSVAPVDLAQAAIGPGMAVFSRYARVVEADGTNMTVRTALALINQVLDETLLEQEGDFDSDTRFCVKWFTQFGWNKDLSGTADTLSRATNTSTGGLERGGVFRAVAGQAWLIAPEELSEDWDPLSDDRTSVWEVALHLARTLANRGVSAAGALMASAGQRVDLDSVKELAYLLFSVCERKGWTSTALLFNALGTSWSELESASRSVVSRVPAQAAFTFDAGN